MRLETPAEASRQYRRCECGELRWVNRRTGSYRCSCGCALIAMDAKEVDAWFKREVDNMIERILNPTVTVTITVEQ